jgi:hypothetical protein
MSITQLTAVGAGLGVAAVVAMVILSASPQPTPDKVTDAARVAALQQLAALISAHYQDSGVLPARLSNLMDGQQLTAIPVDPASGKPYEYEPEADDSYTLCARFDAASQQGEVAAFWMHEAGRRCFRLSPAYGEY